VKCRSTTDLVRQLTADGKTNKQGKPFSEQMLYKLMHNRVYLGEIPHKEKSYPGAHAAIIDQALWDAAHAILGGADNIRHNFYAVQSASIGIESTRQLKPPDRVN